MCAGCVIWTVVCGGVDGGEGGLWRFTSACVRIKWGVYQHSGGYLRVVT